MPRKWTTLAAVVTAVTLTATGLSMAGDEDSPVHKLMEQVNAKSNVIKKAIRTSVSYKKAQQDVVKSVDELIVLGKKAREFKEPSEKQKKTFAEWQKLCDEFVKKTEEYKGIVANTSTTQEQAKKAFGMVNTSCTNCHTVFRVEDEN
jgi:cytochrome c556